MLTMDANSADPVQKQQNTAFDQGLHCLLTRISVQNKMKWKHLPDTPKTRNGFIQMIRLDKSTNQERVKGQKS